MLAISASGLLIGCLLFGGFFSLIKLSLSGIIVMIIMTVVTLVVFNVFYNIAQNFIEKHKNLGER